LLDFIDQMMATAQAGIFVVGLARPELMARRHDLGGRRKTVIRLEPLDDADMARLVDGDSLVRRAEGVPLFAVETVRALIDRDMVIAREGQYVPAPGATLHVAWWDYLRMELAPRGGSPNWTRGRPAGSRPEQVPLGSRNARTACHCRRWRRGDRRQSPGSPRRDRNGIMSHRVSQHPRTARIGVVGAGASGLSVAHHLQRAGYDRVTVLERQPRVGGKCSSIRVGEHVYEMGAVFGCSDYRSTRSIMRSVGAETAEMAGGHCYDADGHPMELFARRQYPRIARQLATYAWLSRVRYRRVNAPGMAGVDPDLRVPFAQFCRSHGLSTLESLVGPPFTGFGYGYISEVPAAYVLKYLDLRTLEAMRDQDHRFIWPEGVESFWSQVARQHDVRTGTRVVRVTRRDSVRVETDTADLEFDALILTSPLDESLDFLDASPSERLLFSAIRYYDYWVLLAQTSGLPPGAGFVPARFTADQRGHLMLWYQRWPDTPLDTLYALGDPSMTQETVAELLSEDLQRMGASLDSVVDVRRWRYFPHVSPRTMAAGYYEQLEALQGANRTYYAGEVMSFASVELCARYSEALVRRHFG
jgi:predicted NAD/FAD-binding protein